MLIKMSYCSVAATGAGRLTAHPWGLRLGDTLHGRTVLDNSGIGRDQRALYRLRCEGCGVEIILSALQAGAIEQCCGKRKERPKKKSLGDPNDFRAGKGRRKAA